LLQETIEHNSKLLKETFLRDLVYGALSGEALADGLHKHGLEWLEKGGSIILLRWTGEDLAMKLNKTESALIEESMVRSVLEFVNQRLEWFEFKNHDYVFLVAEQDPGIIKKSIRKVMYHIHTEYGISMLAAIGQQAADAHGWEQTFHSATSMLEDDSTVSRQLILTYDGFAQRNATQYYYPLELERDIIHMVIQRRKDRLEALTNHLFQENLERRKIGKDMLNQFIYSLHNTFRRVLHQINETEDSLFGPETSLLSQMKSCEGGNGLREAVIGMFSFIVDHIQRTNKELDDSMSDRMLAFIHGNYHKDISLVDLSEQFNASPAYISILFKNYTGENFKEYLNMYRVEKAKQLLQNNKLLKIHEVAGMVGCNHPNTFIRMFKKYEGVSPGSYAKQSFE
jgi:YesN/AraC family two-component response regulator